MLYLIEILHQTTTVAYVKTHGSELYLIEILHQTTTVDPEGHAIVRCILSKFYIKPQHLFTTGTKACVVSYRNSTSNHNRELKDSHFDELYLIEILHQTTTLFLLRVRTKSCILSKFYIKPQRRASY